MRRPDPSYWREFPFRSTKNSQSSRTNADRGAILFCTTNGSGLGHLTRALAIAREIRLNDPERSIVFLVSTPDLTPSRQDSFTTYYVPHFRELQGEIGWEAWHRYVEASALQICDNHGVDVVVFDGYAPFFGLVDALEQRPQIVRVWVRRGMERSGATALADAIEPLFDIIIRPGEAGQRPAPFDGKNFYTNPIVSVDPGKILARADARQRMSVPEGALCVYVQLGSGTLYKNGDLLTLVINALNDYPDLFVVLGESILSGQKMPQPRNGIIMRNYPNYIFFRGFDFAISAAGYNTFNELLYLNIPTIFMPREEGDTEDQAARAALAREVSAAKVFDWKALEETPDSQIRSFIKELRCADVREGLRANAAGLVRVTGAQESAKFVALLKPSLA